MKEYTQRRTDYADAILERAMGAHRLAQQLAAPDVPPTERMALAFQLNRWSLDLSRLSETVRRGQRPDEERPAAPARATG